METGTYLFLQTNWGVGWGGVWQVRKEPVETEDEQSPGDSGAGSRWAWRELDRQPGPAEMPCSLGTRLPSKCVPSPNQLTFLI